MDTTDYVVQSKYFKLVLKYIPIYIAIYGAYIYI